MTRRRILAVVQLGTGLMLTGAALALYLRYLQYTYELTFLSNFCTGVFLIAAGVRGVKGRSVPQLPYLCFTVLLFLVMATSLAFSGNFSFSGPALFLHLINPLAVIACFFFASDMRQVPRKLVPAAVLMPAAYLLFALIFGAVTGNHIYFFLDYGQVGIAYTVIFVLAAGAALLLVSWLLWRVNRLLKGAGASKGKE